MSLRRLVLAKILLLLSTAYTVAGVPASSSSNLSGSQLLAMDFDRAILHIEEDKSSRKPSRRRGMEKCGACRQTVWCAGSGGFCGDCGPRALRKRKGRGAFYCGRANNKRRSKKCEYRGDRKFYDKRCSRSRRRARRY